MSELFISSKLNSLPSELVAEIASYLSDQYFISLANVDERTSSILVSLNKRRINLASCYHHVDLSAIYYFLKRSSASTMGTIRCLDLSNCYWFDANLLTEAILTISTQLEKLSVVGTKLNSSQLARILRNCDNLSELAVSFDGNDDSFWRAKVDLEDDEEITCVLSILYDVRDVIGKLRSLVLHGDNSPFVMFSLFIGFCSNLEILHLEMNYQRCLGLTESLPMSRILRKFGRLPSPCKKLSHITCKINNLNETIDLFAQLLNNIVSQKVSQLVVFWAPNVSVNQYLHRLDLNLTALQTSASSDEMSSFKGITSLRTQAPSFLRNFGRSFTHLKVFSCHYDSEHFMEFAKCHPNLNVLQLLHCLPDYLCEPGTELAEGLGFFKLNKFSFGPKFFSTEVNAFEGVSPAMWQLIAGSRETLDELEIGMSLNSSVFRDVELPSYGARSSCLKELSEFKILTKLTLANLSVDDYNFLSSVLIGCPKLKSLRLSKVLLEENTGKTKHSRTDQCGCDALLSELDTCLAIAHLEDLRLDFIIRDCTINKDSYGNCHAVDLGAFLTTLRQCPSLRRVVVEFGMRCSLQLADVTVDWPELVLACITSPRVDWNTSQFRISSAHPAFQCYLGSSIMDATTFLAPIHYTEMILMDSHVARMPN